MATTFPFYYGLGPYGFSTTTVANQTNLFTLPPTPTNYPASNATYTITFSGLADINGNVETDDLIEDLWAEYE